jgi:hypothetical protein
MKNLFSFIVLTYILLSCSESFLDKQPEDTLSPDLYFKNAKDINSGITAAYKVLRSIYSVSALPHVLGQLSDDGTQAYNVNIWNTFYKTNKDSRDDLWANHYKMIVNCNNIIDRIDKFVPVNDAEAIVVKSYRGEACFLRALAYFNLVRIYGDVPMVTQHWDDPAAAFGIGRTPVNDIYTKVVIPDLEYAFANCFKKGDAAIATEGARATKGAALTILGKVYLTMNDHANAAATLKKLIVDKEAGNYELLSDFSKIWLSTNKFNSESVFEVSFNANAGFPSWYQLYWTIETLYRYGSRLGGGYFVPEKDIMDEFVANQEWTRYKVSVDSSYGFTNNLIQPSVLKLAPPLVGIAQYDYSGTDNNYMVTRYADALLMYAEALMVLGQKDPAAGYVNQVRARVNMSPVTAADLNIDRILHERRMELAFEGHRYFDLVRTGKAIEVISPKLMSNNEYEKRVWRSEPIPEYQLILPIPVAEIEKDQTLIQNPGY